MADPDIALSRSTHDLIWKRLPDGTFDLVMAEGADAVAQQIKIVLKTFMGEWFLDTTVGIPYFEDILKKNPRSEVVETVLRGKIASVTGVTRVTAFGISIDNRLRTMTINYSAETNEGTIEDSFRLT